MCNARHMKRALQAASLMGLLASSRASSALTHGGSGSGPFAEIAAAPASVLDTLEELYSVPAPAMSLDDLKTLYGSAAPALIADNLDSLEALHGDNASSTMLNKLDHMYREAAQSLPRLNAYAKRLGKRFPGAVVFTAPLKGRVRALERIITEFKGNTSKITDLARASIAFVNLDQIKAALQAIEHDKDSPFEVFKVRNKLKNTGYKDVNLTLKDKANGHLIELQLHLACIMHEKMYGQGHKLYEIMRNMTDTTSFEFKLLDSLASMGYDKRCAEWGV